MHRWGSSLHTVGFLGDFCMCPVHVMLGLHWQWVMSQWKSLACDQLAAQAPALFPQVKAGACTMGDNLQKKLTHSKLRVVNII